MNINTVMSYVLVGAGSFMLGCDYIAKKIYNNSMNSIDEKVMSLSLEIFPFLKELGLSIVSSLVISMVDYRFITSFFRTSKIFHSLNEEVSKNPPFPLQGKKTDDYIKRMVQILGCPHKDEIQSVIIIGPPGVGKSALVKELVRRLVSKGTLAYKLKREVTTFFGLIKKIIIPTVYQFDTINILRGTSYQGDLEQNLYEVQNFMRAHLHDIHYMDEFHKLNNDLSINNRNLPDYFKELLTEGVRIIGATTKEEYRRYIKTDKALADRFIVIKIKESKDDDTIVNDLMLTKSKYEKHGMTFTPETIQYLVNGLKSREGCFPRKGRKFLGVISSKWVGNTELHELTKEDIDEELNHWEKKKPELPPQFSSDSSYAYSRHYQYPHQGLRRRVRFNSTGSIRV